MLKIVKGTREKLRKLGPIVILKDGFIEEARETDLKGRILLFLSAGNGLGVTQEMDGETRPCEYRRSIGDIYRFCNSVEKVSLTNVYNTVIELLNEGRLFSAICPGVRRRVYRLAGTNEAGRINHALRDELNTDWSGVEITCNHQHSEANQELELDDYINDVQ